MWTMWDNRNDADLQAQVIHRLTDEYPNLIGSKIDQSLTNFITLLSQNGTWGGSETIWSIHRIFDVNITILGENGIETT